MNSSLGSAAAAAAVSLALVAPRGLAPVHAAERTPIQIADIASLKSVADVHLAPDAARIAYSVVNSDRPGRPYPQIWLMETATRRPVRLAEAGGVASTPRWSPDGRSIAYFGTNGDRFGLVVAGADGSTPRFLAQVSGTNHPLPTTGNELAWSPDGKAIAFVSSTPGPEQAATGDPMVITRYLYKPTASEGLTRFNDNRRLHLFVADVATGQVRQLTSGTTYEHSIDWSPTGDRLLFVSNREADPDRVFNYDVFTLRIDDGTIQRLTSTKSAEYDPAWSPDGRAIAFLGTKRELTSSETTMEDTHVWVMDADGSHRREIGAAIDNRQGEAGWAPDGRSLLCSVQEGGSTHLYRFPLDGGAPAVEVGGDGSLTSWSAARGTIAYAFATPSRPAELFVKSGSTAGAPITALNQNLFASRAIADVERFTFKSFDGMEIEAFLTKPAGAEASRRRVPLIVVMHGGPHGQQGPAFNARSQIYAGHGFATLMVNFRGSTGYGQKLADAIFDDQNGGEAKDVLAGVDAALARFPWLDRDRMGLEGVSYGGQLANWIITQTDRFKAAIPTSGISNLITQNYLSYYHDYLAVEFGAYPKEPTIADALWERSAIRHVKNVRTPTLFAHGENDNDVPIEEAEQFYIGLKDVGVETVMLRYPREGHGIRETKHVQDLLERSLAWYDKHFAGPERPRATGGSVAPGVSGRATLTSDDYARAERFLDYNTLPLVLGHTGKTTWLPDDRFWYRLRTANGIEARLVNPAASSHARCDLPECKAAERQPVNAAPPPPPPPKAIASPDGARAVFIRDNNLWLRDTASGVESALTTDGVTDFAYATDNAGWSHSERPIVLWSPDSKKLATFQQDQRNVGEMYLVDTRVGHPHLDAWKYPLPGDDVVTTIQRVIIDVEARRVIRLQMPADQHRSSLCDDVACRGEWGDVQWSPDGRTLAFVSTSRDHKREQLRLANADTGAVRTVLEETVPTFFESGNGKVSWRYLPASHEAIWFSERDGWGQLYLYDLETGRLKRQLTSGKGNVTQLLHVDETARLAYFVGVGREAGRDPYYRHLYRVSIDGGMPALLTPENADHDVAMARSGRFFTDSYSTPQTAPVLQLRRADGTLVETVDTVDISRLAAIGWQPPTPITVKARDGSTDLYGLMYRPTHFDPSAKYPIVNHIYPGPQTGSVGSRSFNPSRGDAQALAELGFVVVEIDGMGTPWRSKKFHEAWFGDLNDNTLPDQIAAMKELAAKDPWIDLDRAGIYGHSGGGYATADAMFRYPDFFKVGVSEAGNHDNRTYEDDWAEKWIGLLHENADGTSNYDSQANPPVAHNLKGKLLLAHGTMDDNVPPNNTLLVVDALIKANKDFDLIMLPNRKHGFGNEPYMIRRRWDYFVEHLLGAEPPHEYRMHAPAPVKTSSQ